MNGRAWKEWPVIERAGYVEGYVEGLNMGTLALADCVHIDPLNSSIDDAVDQLYPFGMTLSELLDAVDQFYKDPLNARIKIPTAIQVVRDRAKGMDESRIQEYIRSVRRSASQEKP